MKSKLVSLTMLSLLLVMTGCANKGAEDGVPNGLRKVPVNVENEDIYLTQKVQGYERNPNISYMYMIKVFKTPVVVNDKTIASTKSLLLFDCSTEFKTSRFPPAAYTQKFAMGTPLHEPKRTGEWKVAENAKKPGAILWNFVCKGINK